MAARSLSASIDSGRAPEDMSAISGPSQGHLVDIYIYMYIVSLNQSDEFDTHVCVVACPGLVSRTRMNVAISGLVASTKEITRLL